MTLSWLEFKLFGPYPDLAHGVFGRKGGMSVGRYASLNASMSVGDSPANVKENRNRIAKALDIEHLVIPHSSHGAAVSRVTKENWQETHQADALFTTEKNFGLCVTHADCQIGFFYDPVHRAIAIAHSGWRGSVQNIYANVVKALKEEIGSNPADLLVAISPSLGPDHAEFMHYKEELPEEFWRFQVKPHYFDFWEISRMQLTGCGVRPEKIEVAGICTYCAEEDYFSHRREKNAGRNGSVLALKA